MTNTETRYSFIVDTNMYSGNFERPMCAAMTGRTGECGVGREEAEKFEATFGADYVRSFKSFVIQVDDEGCYRPVTIAPTPGRVNNGRGVHFDSDSPEAMSLEDFYLDRHWPAYESVEIFMSRRPTAEEIEFLKERALEFVAEYLDFKGEPTILQIRGFRLVETVVTTEVTEVSV